MGGVGGGGSIVRLKLRPALINMLQIRGVRKCSLFGLNIFYFQSLHKHVTNDNISTGLEWKLKASLVLLLTIIKLYV